MSNHRTASWGFLLILKYSNGVKTLVPIVEWSKDYALKEINKAIKKGENGNCVVWNIDYCLNYNLETSQYFLPESFNDFSIGEVIEINRPYDLGENEEVEDVQKFYPNYYWGKIL